MTEVRLMGHCHGPACDGVSRVWIPLSPYTPWVVSLFLPENFPKLPFGEVIRP